MTGAALGIAVGVRGDGVLRVEDQGYLNVGILKFGSEEGGQGTGLIQGSGAVVEGSEVQVGSDAGSASVVVTDGATLSTDILDVGGSSVGQSTLEVSQSATVTTFEINVEAGGTLNLNNGGTATAAGGNVLPGGKITGDDGTFATLEETGVLLNQGMIFPGNSPGTLTIDATCDKPRRESPNWRSRAPAMATTIYS